MKLVRFDHAAHRLVAGEGAAEVAADSCYADQSHLHGDLKAFTGATPATMAGESFLAVDDLAWPTRGGSGDSAEVDGRRRWRFPHFSVTKPTAPHS